MILHSLVCPTWIKSMPGSYRVLPFHPFLASEYSIKSLQHYLFLVLSLDFAKDLSMKSALLSVHCVPVLASLGCCTSISLLMSIHVWSVHMSTHGPGRARPHTSLLNGKTSASAQCWPWALTFSIELDYYIYICTHKVITRICGWPLF